MADSDHATSALLVLSNANYLVGVTRLHTLHCYSALPKCHSIGNALQVQSCVDFGLNQLIKIMQLGAKP